MAVGIGPQPDRGRRARRREAAAQVRQKVILTDTLRVQLEISCNSVMKVSASGICMVGLPLYSPSLNTLSD